MLTCRYNLFHKQKFCHMSCSTATYGVGTYFKFLLYIYYFFANLCWDTAKSWTDFEFTQMSIPLYPRNTSPRRQQCRVEVYFICCFVFAPPQERFLCSHCTEVRALSSGQFGRLLTFKWTLLFFGWVFFQPIWFVDEQVMRRLKCRHFKSWHQITLSSWLHAIIRQCPTLGRRRVDSIVGKLFSRF